MRQRTKDPKKDIAELRKINRLLQDQLEQVANSSSHDSVIFKQNILLQKQVEKLKVEFEQVNTRLSDLLREKQLIKEKLVASEDHYRLVFEQSKEAMMTLAPPSWRFTSGNPAMCEIFRVNSNEELTSLEPWQASPEFQPDGRPSMEKAMEMIELAMSRGAHFFEWTHKRADGEVFPATVLLTRIESASGIFLNATVRDITGQKKAESALKESEEKLRSLVDSSPYSIQLLDLEGFTVKANRAHFKLFGAVPPHAYTVLDDPFLQKMGLQDDMFRILRGETVSFPEFYYNVHELYSHLPENPVWIRMVGFPLIDHQGNVVNMVLMHEDITESRQARENIRASEEFRKRVFESSRTPIVVMDAESYKYLDCNPAAVSIYRFNSKEETLGKTPLDVSAPVQYDGTPSEEKARYYINQALQNESIIFEWLHRRPDGELWDAEVQLLSFSIEDRKMLQFSLVDITERKRAEQEKEKLQAQLNQAVKMESVGRLAGGIAHDFNNMLGVILGQTEFALLKLKPDNIFYKQFSEIHKAARHSADLTRQLLAFARKQTIAPRVLDVNETVQSMLAMLGRLIGEDIELQWHPGNDLWPVKMDPVQVDQILANLCVNARDAVSGVGKVCIATDKVSFDQDFCDRHAGFTAGDYVLLSVSDDGCGMDAEMLSHLFEPFFTSKEVGQGTGLGLASIYGAIKQNNGFVDVYSKPGQGTTFKIYLPRHAGLVESKPKKEKEPQVIRGHETILLVEDEPMILEVTGTMLEMLGYTVLAAGSPGEAIRRARQYSGRIDLLMTDVVMPEMNGLDLARKLQSAHPDIRKLFMSGYTADIIVNRGILEEDVYFLEKPFSMNSLAAKIREALD